MKRTVLIVTGVVALLLALAVAGPALIDWNRYKDIVTARLEDATGRDVVIAGPLSLRLLPAPAFSARQVTIGNLPGAGDQPLAAVERLDIRLKLLPLVAGKVEVASLLLDRPVLHLMRLADGRVNWQFDTSQGDFEGPAEGRPTIEAEPPRGGKDSEGITINQAVIRDGEITFQSGSNKPLRLTAIDARIAIGGTAGPFSADGQARIAGTTPVRFDVALDRIAPGRGSPVTAKLILSDSGAKLDFAGMLSKLSQGETLNGRLTLAAPDAARATAAFGMPPLPAALAAPLAVEANLAAGGDELAATDLVVSLGDTRATGGITATLGDVPQVEADLRVSAIDIDKWADRPARSESPAPSAPPTPSAPPATGGDARPAAAPSEGRFALPQGIFANMKLIAETLAWQGEVVRNAQLEATLAEGELSVRKLGAQLPGGSTLNAEGVITAAKGQPLFDGSIKLASDNPRALLAWLGTDTDALPAGRLTLASPVKVAWPEVAMGEFRLELGAESARGRLKARLAEPLDFDLAGHTGKWGEVAAAGTLAGNALDARLQAFGVAATVKGAVGHQTRLAIAVRHPDIARLLRQFAPAYRPRGPLGALAFDTQVTGDGANWDFAKLSLEAGALRLTGSAKADLTGRKPQITAELAGNDMALDPFLSAERTGFLLPGGPRLPPTMAPSPVATIPAAAGTAGSAPWSREPLNLSVLQGFDARVGLTAASLAAKGWRLDKATAQLTVLNGGAAIERLAGKLMGGDFNLTARLAEGALAGQVFIAGADVGAAKPEAAGIALTQGRLDAETRFASQGRSSYELVSRLTGDGRVLVKDGVITGFDLPAINQRLNNIENVGSLLGLVQAGLTGGSTRFSQLAGTLQAKDGVVTTRDLKLDAEGGTGTAESVTDLPRWATATTIALRLADSSSPPLVMRLEGPIDNPRKIIDVNALQQYLVARGLGRALKGKEGGLVDQLLGGKRAAPPPAEGAPPQAPQPGQPQPPEQKPEKALRDFLKGLGGR